jgi:hypothetical protein
MKFSWAISWVRWLFNNPEDEDRDGLQNVGFYKTEPPYPADSPRKLHYTHSPGKQQIVYR